MDVSHGAIDRRGHLQQVHQRRRLEIAGAARLDLGVARVLQQHGHPADLKIGAGRDHQIRGARARHQAWLGVHAEIRKALVAV
jgi:hypothetical protein